MKVKEVTFRIEYMNEDKFKELMLSFDIYNSLASDGWFTTMNIKEVKQVYGNES